MPDDLVRFGLRAIENLRSSDDPEDIASMVRYDRAMDRLRLALVVMRAELDQIDWNDWND